MPNQDRLQVLLCTRFLAGSKSREVCGTRVEAIISSYVELGHGSRKESFNAMVGMFFPEKEGFIN